MTTWFDLNKKLSELFFLVLAATSTISQLPQSLQYFISTHISFKTSMTCSTGSLEMSFSFSSSFSELLKGSSGDMENERDFIGSVRNRVIGVPKFKSSTPLDHPISPPRPPPVSPSSYFPNIPSGFNPAELLDSPVLFSSYNTLPSPTTGTILAQFYNKQNSASYQKEDDKKEKTLYSDFSFQTNSIYSDAYMNSLELSYEKNDVKNEEKGVNRRKNFQRRSTDDGYNWRKYGQKQVKASENPRSYYKCTYPNCPTKKKVEKTLEGEITEIVYSGAHSHPKPQSTRRNSGLGSHWAVSQAKSEISDHSFSRQNEIPEGSFVGDDSDVGLQGSSLEGDEDEHNSKRCKREWESEEIMITGTGSTTTTESKVVVQTISNLDVLDDGYRWRKYGQKAVKGNPNPRSYYKCTTTGCLVRKHVERASNDLRAVITTYERKHNHDVPATRGSGSIGRPSATTTTMAIRPSPVHQYTNHIINHSPFTSEMLQAPANYGYIGYNNLTN